MTKYHVDPRSGKASECEAEFHCNVAPLEEHYTSLQAAESFIAPWYSPLERRSAKELMDEAKVSIPGTRLTEANFAELEPDAILITLHHESGDRTYLYKSSDRGAKSISRAFSGASYSPEINLSTLLIGGSRACYIAESPFENQFTYSQLQAALSDRTVFAERLAELIHEAWREERNYAPTLKRPGDLSEVDLASLSFSQLPADWRLENLLSAAGALNSINLGVANGWSRVELASSIHRSWLERNGESAPASQNVPYEKLLEVDKRKDLLVLELAAGLIATYPRDPDSF